jgi:membrane protein DedA with SNARE-associated domain
MERGLMTVDQVTAFLAANQTIAPLVALLLAFAETTAILSLLIPSTVLLMGVGVAVSAGIIPFFPIWLGASIGAILGSSLSYLVGLWFGPRMLLLPPLRDYPDQVARARALFAKWGYLAIPIGHFVGPLRPIVFLLAGLTGMRLVPFMIVNAISAAAWALIVPLVGEIGGEAAAWIWQFITKALGL